jgi:hypothetical protein
LPVGPLAGKSLLVALDSPMSRDSCWERYLPRRRAVEDVGEVALECPAGLSGRLAFGDLAGEIGLTLGMVALGRVPPAGGFLKIRA